jgi:hypothetical protein
MTGAMLFTGPTKTPAELTGVQLTVDGSVACSATRMGGVVGRRHATGMEPEAYRRGPEPGRGVAWEGYWAAALPGVL